MLAARNVDNEEATNRSLPVSPYDSPATQAVARLLAERYSCRAFSPEPVPRAVIERLLDLAQLTASCCNSQPWQVIITEGAGTERFRAALYEHAGRPDTIPAPDFPHLLDYKGVYKARRRECGYQLYDAIGIPHHDRDASARQVQENFRFFGAPHAAIITTAADLGVMGAVDCGAYVANFLLVAHSLGIAAVPQASLAMYAPFTHEFLNIPADRLIVCGISFGYADHTHAANQFRTRRAPLSEVVNWVTA